MLRTTRHLFAPFAIAAVLVSVGACSSNDSSPPVNLGQGDNGNNGSISIDETKIAGIVDGTTLKLSIPVTATTDASGTFNARVIDVQGKNVLGTSPVKYSLRAGEMSTLTVDVPAP